MNMNFDTVVVGAGVIGLASAWELTKRGGTVGLFDPDPGHGASWVAGGMLASVTEAHYGEETLVRLLLAGADRWPAFAEELEGTTGLDIGYLKRGTLVVAVDASDRRALDELLQYRLGLGLVATPMSPTACREELPALAPGIRGGADVPGDHQVDNRKLIAALMSACANAGVDIVLQRVSSLRRTDSGAVSGVITDAHEEVGASSVVLCAGSHMNELYTEAPLLRPVKGHALRLSSSRDKGPLLERTVRGLVHGRPCYLVPRADGSVVVGATSEERGFDSTVQAGAVRTLLEDARALVPGIDELELAECSVGFRPGSPDNAPLVGWTGIDRLAIAGGHFRHGVLLAPITGESVGNLIEGQPVCNEMAPFVPNRTFK
jgi:glycine oxidase